MDKEFKREDKYLVLKWTDLEKYVDHHKRDELLSGISEEIDAGRSLEGKKINTYVVVNEDEPYVEQVWQLIKAHQQVTQER